MSEMPIKETIYEKSNTINEYLDQFRLAPIIRDIHISSCKGYDYQNETIGLTKREQLMHSTIWRRILGLYDTDFVINHRSKFLTRDYKRKEKI